LRTGFPTNTAVALSNITIVGGAISNFIFNVGRRHAYFDRPLIDWNIILAMEPATILGALLGGYLNKVHFLCCTVIHHRILCIKALHLHKAAA
jgi:uncharacterized membrane protein YfcA